MIEPEKHEFKFRWRAYTLWFYLIAIVVLHLPVGYLHRLMQFEHIPMVTLMILFAPFLISGGQYKMIWKDAICIGLVGGLISAIGSAIIYRAPSFYVIPISALLIGIECVLDLWLLAKMNAWFVQTGKHHLVFLVLKETQIEPSPNPTHSR